MRENIMRNNDLQKKLSREIEIEIFQAIYYFN